MFFLTVTVHSANTVSFAFAVMTAVPSARAVTSPEAAPTEATSGLSEVNTTVSVVLLGVTVAATVSFSPILSSIVLGDTVISVAGTVFSRDTFISS